MEYISYNPDLEYNPDIPDNPNLEFKFRVYTNASSAGVLKTPPGVCKFGRRFYERSVKCDRNVANPKTM